MKTLFFLSSILFAVLTSKAQASFSIASNICSNTTITLSANTGSLTNCSYTWSSSPTGALFSNSNNSTTTVSFANPGLYTLTLFVTSGILSSTAQNTLTVFPLPTITAVQSDFTTCITSNAPLISKPVQLIANGGTSYTWTPPISPLAGNPNGPLNTVRPNVTDCFTVTGENYYGCTSAAAICVTVMPRFTISVSPSNTIVCPNSFNGPSQMVKLVASNPQPPASGLASSHSYTWSGFGLVTSPISPTVYAGTYTTGIFTAVMRDSLNCISLPATATVTVVFCTGIETVASNNVEISIYPNPAKDRVNLIVKNSDSPLLLKIYDLFGQEVKRIGKLSTEIDVSDLSPGVYFFSIESVDVKTTYKVIKE